jgi:hypothetical protein
MLLLYLVKFPHMPHRPYVVFLTTSSTEQVISNLNYGSALTISWLGFVKATGD